MKYNVENKSKLLNQISELLEYTQDEQDEISIYLTALRNILHQEHMFENKETFDLLCAEADSYVKYIKLHYECCETTFPIMITLKRLVWKKIK